MNIKDKLKARRKELGYTLEYVGDYIGVNKSTVRKWEEGDINSMKQSHIKRYAEVLKLSPLEFLEDDGRNMPVMLPANENMRTIFIYGDISCGTGLFVDDNIIDAISIPVQMLSNKNAEHFGQYAQGDSMSGAGINDGDLIIFRKSNEIENGQIGCFCIDENIATCKRFLRKGGDVWLMPENENYPPIHVDPSNACFRIIGVFALILKKSK